ncbi:MAG: hypothetical protein COB02_12970 [Candidatus Cloacimonadota bacterium]|nr:MAG: hypothetical protein COB02_12970 [Candidatus Cloacimonadota bacterium]
MDEYKAYLYIKANHDWIVYRVPQGFIIQYNDKDYFSSSIEQAVCNLLEDCERFGIDYQKISSLIQVDLY